MAVVFVGLFLLAFEFEVEPQSVPEPETIGTVYYFDSRTNSLRPLERQIARVKWKRNLGTIFGITGAKAVAELKETKSPFRIRQGEKLEFLVRLPTGVDPGKFQLFSWSIKDQKRWTMVSRPATTSKKTQPGLLLYDVVQVGESLYKLIPVQELRPGEYGFSPDGSNEVFCFGIDAG